jgi:outer membrane beta-barrel protein
LQYVRTLVALVAAATLSSAAYAQDDDLDDIFGTDDTQPTTVAEERNALLDEGGEAPVEKGNSKKRVIKTLQRKNFVKVGRYEVGPHLGFITNDPFLNRYLVGVGGTYHVTEVFGVELSGTFSPDFGDGDYKPITDQIINENQVTPDISKIQLYTNLNFQFSPIYGKAALLGRGIITFDIYGVFGTGVVRTVDDLEALDAAGDPIAEATRSQFHPTLNYGGGMRLIFSPSFAIRVEARGLSYIEVLESTTLEMKNNMTMLLNASFFFPGIE